MRLRWLTVVLVIASILGAIVVERQSVTNGPSQNANPRVGSNEFSHFTPLSASFATNVDGWALGTATCHLGRECLVLQATVDGGHAWTPAVNGRPTFKTVSSIQEESLPSEVLGAVS